MSLSSSYTERRCCHTERTGPPGGRSAGSGVKGHLSSVFDYAQTDSIVSSVFDYAQTDSTTARSYTERRCCHTERTGPPGGRTSTPLSMGAGGGVWGIVARSSTTLRLTAWWAQPDKIWAQTDSYSDRQQLCSDCLRLRSDWQQL